MSSIPSLSEVNLRFNAACEAFDAALDASKRGDADAYDTHLKQAARDMGGALDLGALRCVCIKAPKPIPDVHMAKFPKLLHELRALGAVPLDSKRIKDLHRWRDLRNRAEHAPIEVPALVNLLEALSGTRKFLVDAFHNDDDLCDPASPSSIHADPASDHETFRWLDSHRHVSPISWIKNQIQEGLLRLNAGRPRNEVLPEKAVYNALTKLAIALLEPLAHPAACIALAIVKKTLEKHTRLYFEAGWLVSDGVGVRFQDPRLPALLIGLEIAEGRLGQTRFRTTLASRREWCEVAWAATVSGDRDSEWFTQLLEMFDWDRLPDRVMTACAALAGMRPAHDDGQFEHFADTASMALVWMIPVINPERLSHSNEITDPWRLERPDWQRAALDLARGTELLPGKSTTVSWKQPLGKVGTALSKLALPPRVSDAAANAALTLLRPWANRESSPLDPEFFRVLFSLQDGLEPRFELNFLQLWMSEIGARALWQGDPRTTARIMTVVDSGHPAGFLLNYEDLYPFWCEAWKQFVTYSEPADAAHAWVKAALRAASMNPSDRVVTFLLSEAPEKLKDLGAWEFARTALAKELGPNAPAIRPNEGQIRYAAKLFSMAAFTAEEWRQRIAVWCEKPTLPWRVLVEAGAPHDAITTWCITKLRKKMRDAPHTDGPVGIIASKGAEILSTNNWEFAYEQAWKALLWLLDHGDESAISQLADACFQSDEAQRFGPTMAKFAGLHVPLWQILWGRTITRPAGRTVFLCRAESGTALGEQDVHFLPGNAMQGVIEGVWDMVAWQLAAPVLEKGKLPSDDSAAEARRLFIAFGNWMTSRPVGRFRWEQSRHVWADGALRATKSMVLFSCALHGIDVAEPVRMALSALVDDGHAHEQQLFLFMGPTVDFLCKRLTHPPVALLELAATPQVAERLAIDESTAFWTALLREFGLEKVIRLVDDLKRPDMGLGFFDALAIVAPNALKDYQARPDLLRSVLVRSAEGLFTPSRSFHERAWANPRRPEDVPDVNKIPIGEWLRHFLEQSRAWPNSDREHFLRALAQHSHDGEIRRICIHELLQDS